MTYTIDGMPDYVPWPLLIRAKFVHEIDAVLASIIIERVGQVASAAVTRKLVEAAHAGVGKVEAKVATAEQRVMALNAVLDWDDWCGTPWPRHWPPHHGLGFDDVSDPITTVLKAKSLDLVKVAGSEHLQVSLGAALTARQTVRT